MKIFNSNLGSAALLVMLCLSAATSSIGGDLHRTSFGTWWNYEIPRLGLAMEIPLNAHIPTGLDALIFMHRVDPPAHVFDEPRWLITVSFDETTVQEMEKERNWLDTCNCGYSTETIKRMREDRFRKWNLEEHREVSTYENEVQRNYGRDIVFDNGRVVRAKVEYLKSRQDFIVEDDAAIRRILLSVREGK